MLDNLLQAIVALKTGSPGKVVLRQSVFLEMIAVKGFRSDCGMTFPSLVKLAEDKGLVQVDH